MTARHSVEIGATSTACQALAVTDFVRQLDAPFDALDDWPYRPHDHLWDDLRVRYVDEGPTVPASLHIGERELG